MRWRSACRPSRRAAACWHGDCASGLSLLDGVTLRDLGRDPSAIVSFTIDGIEARDVVKKADEAGITIGASGPVEHQDRCREAPAARSRPRLAALLQ